jgi:SAM-dependent methyltransferase
MPDFSRRSSEPEWMDGEDVPQEDFAGCLADLDKVNTLTLTRRPTLAFVDEALVAASPGTVPVIVDVGFGAGDMLRAVERLCRRKGYAARLIGIDLNPRSEPYAKAHSPADSSIEWHTSDLYDWPESDGLDLVISSQVTHHMCDAEIVHFLGWMEERTRLGWFVNDLHRHWFAWHGFRLLGWLMRWHPMVRHDGAISVLRSFTRADWDGLLASAGIGGNVTISWKLMFRYAIARRKW